MMLIVSALSLLVVPDFLLLTWQQAGLSILMLVMTALCFHWFNYFKARNFCISSILFLLTLAYAHSSALSLLGQAERISSLPNKITLDLHISEILHQQDYQTLVATASLFDGKEQKIFINWRAPEKPQLGEVWRADVKLRPISARLNHGGFDRQQWYFSKRIIAVGNVKSAVKIGDDFSFRTDFLQNSLKQTEGLSLQGLLIALAFGERAWLDNKIQKLAEKTTALLPQDVQATLAEFTVQSIVLALNNIQTTLPCRLLVCGGGAKNQVIMNGLKQALPNWRIQLTTELNLDIDYVEAAAFAWLAYRRMHNLPANLPSVTGATSAVSLGAIFPKE